MNSQIIDMPCNQGSDNSNIIHLPSIDSNYTILSSISNSYSSNFSSIPTPTMFLSINSPNISGTNVNRATRRERGASFNSNYSISLNIQPDNSYLNNSINTTVSGLGEQLRNVSTSYAETEIMDLESNNIQPTFQRQRRNAITINSSSIQDFISLINQ